MNLEPIVDHDPGDETDWTGGLRDIEADLSNLCPGCAAAERDGYGPTTCGGRC